MVLCQVVSIMILAVSNKYETVLKLARRHIKNRSNESCAYQNMILFAVPNGKPLKIHLQKLTATSEHLSAHKMDSLKLNEFGIDA